MTHSFAFFTLDLHSGFGMFLQLGLQWFSSPVNMNLNLLIFAVPGLKLWFFYFSFFALYKNISTGIKFLQSFINWNLKSHISLFLWDRLLHSMKDQGQMIHEELLLTHSDGCLQLCFLLHCLPKNRKDSERFSRRVCSTQVCSAAMEALGICTSAAHP